MTIADEKIVLYTWLENKNLMWQKNNLTKSKFILKITHNGTTLSSKMCFIFLAIVRNSSFSCHFLSTTKVKFLSVA